MNRFLNILISAALLIGLASSCGEKAPALDSGIVAQWQLSEMTGYEAENLPQVYIEFTADKNFVIYQKVGDVPRFRKYDGTYTIAGSILTGEYSDKEKWGSAYKASIEADGEVLVLTAVTLDKETGAVIAEGEICRYVKASLSQEEKDAADVITKAETAVRFL